MAQSDVAAEAPWMRAGLSADERARRLLDAATLKEKVHMLHGAALPAGVDVDGYVPGIDRLGVPALLEKGSGAGLTAGIGATALPAPIAQAATWDVELSRRCGVVVGLETRAQGSNVAIGGDVNIARIPLNGRTFEAYGEDPLLAGRMIVPHLRAVQEQGLPATVKHYALNNHETNRGSPSATYPPDAPGVDCRVDERTMREIYLPAFEAAVKDADVGVVMTSYNRVNGEWASQNQVLLGILKKEWGFAGFVVSDWVSTHSTVEAALAGLDQEMPTGKHFGDPLIEAVRSGKLDESVVDKMALRIWRTMFQFGLFDADVNADVGVDVDADADADADAGADDDAAPVPSVQIGCPDHLQAAEDVAAASAVLLKNDGLLPLAPRELARVAVIGADADSDALVVAGGGSSHVRPVWSDTDLSALRERLPDAVIEHVTGTDPVQGSVTMPGLEPVPSWALRTGVAVGAARGLNVTYYPEPGFAGPPVERRVDPYIAVQWRPGRRHFNSVPSSIPPPLLEAYSAVWEGVFVVPASGSYTFDLTSVEGSRLYWDGELLIDNSGRHPERVESATAELTAGDRHAIRVEYSPETLPITARVKLGWAPPPAAYDEALRDVARAAAAADVAVVVARDLQSEGRDQASLALPNGQDRLISAVLEANPRTVVVLRTGGPVLMPWLDQVPAVLQAWYGGSRGGAALAKLLTGDVVPSGKLPITFPRDEADLPTREARQFPGVDGQAHYDEKLEVGYRHYDANGVTPLFPFGYGLSYTRFAYRSLMVAQAEGEAPGLTVSFEVVNAGDREGVETAQVYLTFPAQAGEPPQRLVGFARVRLLAGESRRVEVTVGERELSIWDEQAHDWRIVAGTHTVRVGGSSRDQPLSADVVIGAAAEPTH